jgi:ATP-dependent RNA helicase DDX21
MLSVQALKSGLDILVGTPGRIFDHIERGNLDLSKLKHVILDEVDQMLDMGFAEIVDNILQNAYVEGKTINFYSVPLLKV